MPPALVETRFKLPVPRAQRVELLAPAGSFEALVAAVENGADAVYLAGQHFGARKFAQNFTEDELVRAVDYAHVRGVKAFVTVNTLVKDQEFADLVRFLHVLHDVGVDAIIAQDLGVVRAARELVPDLPVHISTQATVHNSAGVRWLEALGCERVILAREMDVREVRQMKERTGAELETFVHGALCYCYSGQCLASSLIGGRSGNRGACAYTCRLPFDLTAGGAGATSGPDPTRTEPEQVLARKKHVLSSKDLQTLDAIPEMIEAGVSSFKIEGRMKRPEYVATAVGVYRKAIDRYYAGDFHVTPEERERLLRVFNREFTQGFHKDGAGRWAFTNWENAGNRGGVLGRVVRSGKGWVRVRLEGDLRVGDGIEILHSAAQWEAEAGGQQLALRPTAHERAADRVARKRSAEKLDDFGPEEWGWTVREIRVEDRNARGHAAKMFYVGKASAGDVVELKGHQLARPGDPVHKSADFEVLEAARRTYEGGNHRKVAVRLEARLHVGLPLRVVLTEPERGVVAEHVSEFVVAPARSAPLSQVAAREQLGRLGDTPFQAEDVRVDLDPRAFVPIGVLNEARRAAGAALERALVERHRRAPVASRSVSAHEAARPRSATAPRLVVKCWGLPNVEAAVGAGADEVYFSGLRVGGLQPRWDFDALTKAADLCAADGARLWIDSGGVQHDWEVDMLRRAVQQLKTHAAFAGVLAGHHGAMQVAFDEGVPFVADHALNAFNSATVDFLVERGARRVVLSPELTLDEIRAIAAGTVEPLEIVAHGRLPLMTSEYCSIGHATECQKRTRAPCHERPYAITDPKGYRFPLVTDGACRMVMLNSVEMNTIDRIPDVAEAGVDVVRIDTAGTRPEAVAVQVRTYRDALAAWEAARRERGAWTFDDRWWTDLAAECPDGFTTGHLYRGPL
ncbi:MAG TPA: DUF3656 domain-containing protein [Candidatus Thermoplasmatota archaeon]|nr:DUF3656 domain-containing protein [Candidatus Thermoplasmatota archaeon]